MSDFLTVLLIMIGVGLLFLLPTAFIGGKKSLIVVTIVLTGISCFLLMYGKALGSSFSNSNRTKSFDWDAVLMSLAFAALYAFIAYGCFCLNQVLNDIDGYKIKLLIWGIILIGYPMYLIISAETSLHNMHKKHYESEIIIAHPIDFPILIDRLRFFDSKTNKSSSLSSRFLENDRMRSSIEGLSYEYEFMQSQRYYTRLPKILIPIDFDTFELSWYSVPEQKFYRDTFSIDQKKLKVGENYDKQLIISDMLIHILPGGHVELLKNEYRNYTHLYSYFDVDFKAVEGQSIDSIWKQYSQVDSEYINYNNLNYDFKILNNGTVEKLTPEEILAFSSVHTYAIQVELIQKEDEVNELEEIKVIDFYLNQYTRSTEFLRKEGTKPLPSFIQIELLKDREFKGRIEVMFDKKELLNQFNAFTTTPKEDVFFKVTINVADLNKSTIELHSKDETLMLNNWHITD
ncbi:hypothetical protein [Formosa sp. PL04]|uniref:hypothetical protein n=1 Tax=Formosa sp. PL04 TaxID=3081755 RepID=UPI002981BF7A|nr:hypothetical protein [Formosa sp. PL04]MDW5288756.1 hypothetical protein [Formosa sp. PL04]